MVLHMAIGATLTGILRAFLSTKDSTLFILNHVPQILLWLIAWGVVITLYIQLWPRPLILINAVLKVVLLIRENPHVLLPMVASQLSHPTLLVSIPSHSLFSASFS